MAAQREYKLAGSGCPVGDAEDLAYVVWVAEIVAEHEPDIAVLD